MKYTRLIITAVDAHWLRAAADSFCGFATSVIACDAEIGIERLWDAEETPDGRMGLSVLVFGFSSGKLEQAVVDRVGQCVMTCPTTAVFNGLESSESTIKLGQTLRYFGDGFQRSKKLGRRRLWRIPVMDGEFLVDAEAGVAAGIAGGNLILQDDDPARALTAAREVVAAMAAEEGVITPFPGGVVRCGSKVGSRYTGLRASTNEAYCPDIAGRVETKLVPDAQLAYEVVVDAVDDSAMRRALSLGLEAAQNARVLAVTAGNYGGKLGKHLYHLVDL